MSTGTNARFVNTPAAFAEMLAVLRGANQMALDTEGNSFHAYVERVCLIQIGIVGAEFVVDPLAIDVRGLGEVLSNEITEVVLHGADFDIRTLKRDYGFRFARIFDTQAAARVLAWPETGLAAIVQKRFGATLSKVHQKSDWGRRPLSADQVAYAASDVRYLIPLRDLIGTELATQGREAKAKEEFAKLAAVEPRPKKFDTEGYRRIRGARELEPMALAMLRELYLARERQAEASNRPPFKVAGNDVLIDVARRMPADLSGLSGIRGLTPRMLERVGKPFMEAVNRGREAATAAQRPSDRNSDGNHRSR
jgi:ribonuclease D